MINFLVSLSDKSSETENLVIKCFETAGFEVVKQKKGTIGICIRQNKSSTTQENQQLNIQESIFPSIPKLSTVFEFIEFNYDRSIRLKEVAQAVGYSSAYLTDLVRRMTGKTVNDWIIERRIVEAQRLLLETKYSIEQIAFKVGYQSINHFYCQFRNYCQNTPRAWREAYRCQPDRH